MTHRAPYPQEHEIKPPGHNIGPNNFKMTGINTGKPLKSTKQQLDKKPETFASGHFDASQ